MISKLLLYMYGDVENFSTTDITCSGGNPWVTLKEQFWNGGRYTTRLFGNLMCMEQLGVHSRKFYITYKTYTVFSFIFLKINFLLLME